MSEVVLQGPFLTRSQAAHRSGLPKAELPDRPDLLRLGGKWTEEVYFDFQFDDHGIRRDIGRVVSAVRGHREDEVIADWLVRANTHLSGATPLAVLNSPHGLDRVLKAITSEPPAERPGKEREQVELESGTIGPSPLRPERRDRVAPRRRTASPHPA